MPWYWRAAIAVVLGAMFGLFPFMTIENRLSLLLMNYMDVYLGPGILISTLAALLVASVFPLVIWVILVHLTAVSQRETRCRKCGYILRGLTEPRCSECGERI